MLDLASDVPKPTFDMLEPGPAVLLGVYVSLVLSQAKTTVDSPFTFFT